MSDLGADATPRIDSHPDRDGIRIVDPIDHGEFALWTDCEVDPIPASDAGFVFPVTTVADVVARRFRPPSRVIVYVRDADGRIRAEAKGTSSVDLEDGRWILELDSTPLKVYLLVDGAVSVRWDGDVPTIAVDAPSVRVGVRSFHDTPAGTVTTSADPEDLMAAISTFGSALKTTSPERSFPTLRGHPPLVELGDRLDVPAGLEPPETGVVIEVPPDHGHVSAVASLAFYLGATIRPGPEPRLFAAGESFSLADPDFETAVRRALERTFLLDCLVRTEGYYPVDLHERSLLTTRVDIDCAALYDASIATRTARALSIPYETVADVVPWWPVAAHVVPEPSNAAVLPFLAERLAFVETIERPAGRTPISDDAWSDIDALFDPASANPGAATVRSSSGRPWTSQHVFSLPESGTMEQVYVGDGVPVGACKLSADACRRRLDHEPRADAASRIVVVHNDTELRDDDLAPEQFSTQRQQSVDVRTHEQLSTDELAGVLARDAEFCHYIGHVDERGMRCHDGYLDAHDLDTVGVDAFLLNACHSYEQGRALVERGAYGGVVTTAAVTDDSAAQMGYYLARLLDCGFSLLAALDVALEAQHHRSQYLVVGDGTARVATSEDGFPYLLHVDACSGSDVSVRYQYYVSDTHGIGSLFTPYLADGTRILHREGFSCAVDVATFVDTFDEHPQPYVTDDGLYWPDEVSVAELLSLADDEDDSDQFR